MENPYDELSKSDDSAKLEISRRSDLKKIYFQFLQDFRHHLAEFVRESMVELSVAEIPVSTKPISIFNGEYGGMQVVIKNQGQTECYITTAKKGGFRLDPGEKERLWLNKPLVAITPSGNTTIGLIRT